MKTYPKQSDISANPHGLTNRIPKIGPSIDPVLRVIRRVLKQTELTYQQKFGLIVLWRLLRKGQKEIGAALLAGLLNTTVHNAELILSALQRKGYIKSNGKYVRGQRQRATRQLTDKIKLPRIKNTKNGHGHTPQQRLNTHDSNPSAGTETKDSAATEIDYVVSHGASARSNSHSAPDNNKKNTIPITHLLGLDKPFKKKKHKKKHRHHRDKEDR